MTTTRYFHQRDELPDQPDIFSYDEVDAAFRVKVSLAVADLWDAIDQHAGARGATRKLWTAEMLRSLGVRSLPHATAEHYFDNASLNDFFLAVEVALARAIAFSEGMVVYGSREDAWLAIRLTVVKLNTLMNYHAVGYQIVAAADTNPSCQVIRRDTQYTHQQLTRPTLALLTTRGFEHVDSQFRDAHEEYLKGNYADAITDAASAVESFLKVILGVSEGTLSLLLREAGKQDYFPTYLSGSITQWETLLQGTGNLRNKQGDAHGRDGKTLEPWQLERYARYALNLSAANMLFLADERKARG